MLRGLSDRIARRNREAAVRMEAEREQMSAAERRLAGESVEDFQADEFVGEHLGDVEPDRLLGDDNRPSAG